MRAVLAVTLVLALAVSVAAPHLHLDPQGPEGCAACLVRGGEAAAGRTPDLAPDDLPAGEVALAPASHPRSGAPLGAVPGQSPPRA